MAVNFLKDFTGNHDEHVTNTIGDATKANKTYGGLSDADYKKLANLNFKNGGKAFTEVNPFNLVMKAGTLLFLGNFTKLVY